MASDNGFPAEEYRHTRDLLLNGSEAEIKATLSNNLNIIIAALEIAAEQTTDDLDEKIGDFGSIAELEAAIARAGRR